MKNLLLLFTILSLNTFILGELNWITEPQKAFAVAKETGKPIFVDVFTTWCHWCHELDKRTFSHADFITTASSFVLLKADGDIYQDFRRQYNVKGYPTMLFLNASGAEVRPRVVGFVEASTLVPIMKKVVGAEEAQTESITWYTQPDLAFAAAKSQNKPIFADVFTTWCSWCKKLDAETFSTEKFQQEAARFILLKVDGDRYRDFVLKYSVKGYPTMLFLNGDAQEVHDRVVGFRTADELVATMREVHVASYSLVWHNDPAAALKEAHATEKRIFAVASMVNCPWCVKLEKETFTNAQFIAIAEKYVLLKLDRTTHAEFLQKFEIKGYPTMLFLTCCGKEFHPRVVGYRTAEVLAPLMEKALKTEQGE